MTARYPYGLAAVLAVCACVAVAPASAAPAAESAAPAAASAADPQAERQRHDEEMRQAAKRNTHEGRRLADVQKRLRKLEARARAALPADATPEQVRAELEDNPRKYPAYRQLVLAAAELRTEMGNNHSQAQKSIRAYHTHSKVAEDRARGAATEAK